VDDKRAGQTSEPVTFSHCTSPLYFSFNYFIKKKVLTSNEYQLQFVLQVFERDFQFDICKAARFYNVLCIILSIWINGVSMCANIIVNLQKLIVLEEEVVCIKSIWFKLARISLLNVRYRRYSQPIVGNIRCNICRIVLNFQFYQTIIRVLYTLEPSVWLLKGPIRRSKDY